MDFPREKHIKDFLAICKLEGKSCNEREIADYIKYRCGKLNVRVDEDDAFLKTTGNTGNLICFPPGYNPEKEGIVLLAHLDTVQSTKNSGPEVNGDKICGSNNMPIGVDNRVGVAALLKIIEKAAKSGNNFINFLIVFCVCEEIGLFGSKYLKLPENIKMGFVFDSSARPGVIVTSTNGCTEFTVRFIGKSSHSGVSPENGINAIKIASEALYKTKVGKIDGDLTLNIGKIKGGEAINMIPPLVEIQGEVRSKNKLKIDEKIKQIHKNFEKITLRNKGRMEFEVNPAYEPFKIKSNSKIYKLVRNAIKNTNINPTPVFYKAGSDANSLNSKGIPSVNLGIGAQNPHSPDEFVYIDDLIKTYEIAFQLIKG